MKGWRRIHPAAKRHMVRKEFLARLNTDKHGFSDCRRIWRGLQHSQNSGTGFPPACFNQTGIFRNSQAGHSRHFGLKQPLVDAI